nr:hypothetical protein [Streptomyces sp. N502]
MPLPSLDGLTEQQVRGTACVWCETSITTATAVDLGQRRHRRLDGHYSTFPRACALCVRTAADEERPRHADSCEQCVDDAALCDTARALRRLALEGRP